MGILSNRVAKDDLKVGDHIYSWRSAYTYAHHGASMFSQIEVISVFCNVCVFR